MSDNTTQQIPLAATTSRTICGIAASPGIVIGRAMNMGRRKSKRRKHTHLDPLQRRRQPCRAPAHRHPQPVRRKPRRIHLDRR